jgi:hypothetical protein
MEFSTAVAFGGNKYSFDPAITGASRRFAQVQDMQVLGKELTMKEAVAVAQSGKHVFDKIILLVSHGEASCVTEEESRTAYGDKVEGDFALTQHVSFAAFMICREPSLFILQSSNNLF